MSIPRIELFKVWSETKPLIEKNSAVLSYVLEKLQLNGDGDDLNFLNVKKLVKDFTSKLSDKWKNCHRMLKTFLSRHQHWLDENIVFTVITVEDTLKHPSVKLGRPCKDFSEVGSQSKRQKIAPLLENFSTPQLIFASASSLRKSGLRDAAKMVQTVSENAQRATEIKKQINAPIAQPIKYTPEEALALYVDGHYTKKSYILMQSGAKERNANIYPSYNLIKKAKEDCYPDEEFISISDITGEVRLQALVNHTTQRLVLLQKDVLEQNISELKNGITLFYKWGCDGSAGHSTYKQKFTSEGSEARTDSYLFAVCLVPIRLQNNKKQILWNNPRPSSTRFCRPIKILFEKETTELSKKEIKSVEDQIKNITPTKVTINDQEITVNHTFKLTMIDGKMFGVITESSTQTCGICGATPKIMNELNKMQMLVPKVENLDFGVSTLHAWIRCLETLLHISYRLTVKKWQIRENADKIIVKERKNNIIHNLRTKMGLLIDIPKPGFGTTNDGNTARRFFRQPSLVASITGIDENLIERFSVLLRTMSSGYAVNIEAFRVYARETAEKYVELYSWYYMPSSIHKILIHGADIIKAADLPIGMFSEEALESRNKDFKRIREFNTRKFSREKTMTDLFHSLLFSSDPFISSISKSNFAVRSYQEPLNNSVLKLLNDPALPDLPISREISDDESDDSV